MTTVNISAAKLKRLLNKNCNIAMLFNVFVILCGYTFFLSSDYIFNRNKPLKYTEMNSTNTIDNRDITLVKWIYSPKDLKMEIELDIINNDYDANDKYSVCLIDRKGMEYTCNLIIESPTMLVIQAENVPQDFKELRLGVSVDYSEKTSEMAKYYVSRDSVEYVDNIVTYDSLESYYIAKLDRYIAAYNEDKIRVNEELEKENSNYSSYEELLNNYNFQKNYAAGNEVAKIDNQIVELNKKMTECLKKINELEKQIEDIDKKISDYKAIKKAYEN